MALFDEKIQKQLRDIFSKLTQKVNLLYFTQEFECGTCKDNRTFLEEVSALSDKLNVTGFDFVKDKEKAVHYKVERIPATVLLDSKDNDTGIKYYGIPGGYEINSFIQSIFEASGIRQPLPQNIIERITKIGKDVHIQVLVSLT